MRYGAALLAAIVFAAAPARAADGVRPRSLVVWSDVACLTVVERNVDAVLHLPYAVAFEDTEHTADEVPDGRRHQMIGFCRQHSPQSPLPVWLSQADVDAAAAIPLVEPADLEPGDILDADPSWADCTTRIVPDDARRPITAAAAAAGVDWDTSGLPRGGWVVEGYTWDPPFNQWSPRPGVVAIYDDAAATDNPPVAAISSGELSIYADEVAMIEGCVSAAAGSTLSASWAPTVPGPEQQWQPFVTDEPIAGASFALAFAPPAAVVGANANIRVEITDGSGASYVAYMREAIVVLPGSAGGCDDTGGGFLADPGCDSSGDAGANGDDGTAADSSGTADAAPSPGNGCGCAAMPRPASLPLLWMLAWVHRRRAPH